MSFIKYQFATEEEKERLIYENQNLQVHEVQYLLEGNFIVFRDGEIPITPVYLLDTENVVEQLKADNLTTLEAIAEVYEMILTMQG